MLRRHFSTSAVANKSLKSKLREVLVSKRAVETHRNDDAVRRANKQKQIESYQQNKQTEKALVSHLDDYFSNLNNVIKKKPDFAPKHPAVYRYLGTSKSQLQNPYVVSDEVTKMLKKKKLAKAVFIVRLAGSKGSVAMNQILQYLSNENRHKTALRLFNQMKKWGAKENELTNAAIVASGSNSANSRERAGKILSTFEKAKDKIDEHDRKRQTLNANSTLRALSAADDVASLVQVYEDIRFKDIITYTTVLNAIARKSNNNSELADLKLQIWQEVQDDIDSGYFEMDPRLVRSYINANYRTPTEAKESLGLLKEYFQIPGLSGTGNVEKFPFTKAELDLLMKVYFSLGQHKQAIEFFEQTQKSMKFQMEWAHYNYYAKAIAATEDTSRAKLLIDKFESFDNAAPSTMYADLMRTFRGQSSVADLEYVEKIKKSCQKAWGKRPHIALLDAYASVFAQVYTTDKQVHPRYGLKAMNDIAKSYQVFAHNLTVGKNVDMCKNTIDNTINLGRIIYNHKAWAKHRFLWLKKMVEMCEVFQAALETDSGVPAKAIEEFVYDMDTIVRRGQGKSVNVPVMSPIDGKNVNNTVNNVNSSGSVATTAGNNSA